MSLFGRARKSFETDFLKTSLYFSMHPKVSQKFFVRNRGLSSPFVKCRKVFLVLPKRHADGVINEIGHRPAGMDRLDAKRTVKGRVQVNGRTFRRLTHANHLQKYFSIKTL
jgi:hypothetical protein